MRLLHLQKIEQQQMQLQASMYMNMDGVESMEQKMVNNPGFTQSELGNNMLYSSDSKKGKNLNTNSKNVFTILFNYSSHALPLQIIRTRLLYRVTEVNYVSQYLYVYQNTDIS